MAADLVLIKLGGSLLTDKTQPESLRMDILRRVAGEIADLARERQGGVVVGHGSGSFGHVTAARWRVHEGVQAAPDGADPLEGISRTQHLAARLHRRVVAELLAAGARPWSFVPSSASTTARGRIASFDGASLEQALDLGLLPVTYGDVLMDREQGCAIASTEAIFEALAEALERRGWTVGACLWLGETDGILDRAGRRIPEIRPGEADDLLPTVGGSAGTDVTGGMRLRLETALRLAAKGIESWILDGRQPQVFGRALGGDAGLGGTHVARSPRS
jgi:isopentenyl phosphate kinase